MTPQELEVSIIHKLIFEGVADDNDEILRPIWEVTYWDKKFQNIDKNKQPKVLSYASVLARDFPKIETKDGDVLILSTGLYRGFTTEEKLGFKPSCGEIVSIPGGGSASVKYWNGKFVTADNRIATSRDVKVLNNKFLFYYFKCNLNMLDSFYRGTSLKHPDMSEILEMKLPLYPIDIQDQIVQKIEEIMPLIQKYGDAWKKLESLNKKFPIDMERSLLQYAIEGKVVEQISDEGSGSIVVNKARLEKNKLLSDHKIKKEKNYDPIDPDEIPFEIPESWVWTRLVNITAEIGDGIHGTPIYNACGDYWFINGNNLIDGKIVFKEGTKKIDYNEYLKYNKPLSSRTILMSINGTIGNLAFYDNEKIILGKSACYVNVLESCYKEYVNLFFRTNYFLDYASSAATQTTIKNVSLQAMRNVPIPIPPIEEQKRIVAKIEELLPLCRQLIKQSK